jgi:hypothetical protein
MLIQIHTFLSSFKPSSFNIKNYEYLSIILALLLLSFLIEFFLVRSFMGRYYRIFVAPGIIVHELSHAFACLITGAEIKRINLFEPSGGSVEHSNSKIPVLGQAIVSFAPF